MKISETQGALYTNDGRKIMDVQEFDMVVDSERSTEIAENYIDTYVLFEKIKVTAYRLISLRDMIGLTIWKRPSNNWMKMHGGIMERKVQKRKARILMNRKRRTEEENGNG